MLILVTGPHRSGTTFVSRCIAYDRELEFVPEERVNKSLMYYLSCFARDDVLRVVQAPFAAPWLHQLREWQPEIIWVKRPDAEILASRQRMYDRDGTQLHWILIEQRLREHYNAPYGEILKIQRECWEDQKLVLDNTHEVNYHDFDDHPLHRDNRENYHHRQTEVGHEVEPRRHIGNVIAF